MSSDSTAIKIVDNINANDNVSQELTISNEYALENVREAYLKNDINKIRDIHNQKRSYSQHFDILNHAEAHKNGSCGILKAVIFGGLDGIVTLFAVVAGAIGVGLPCNQIVVLGICNLLADGVSMGLGEYASVTAENDYFRSEIGREEWEIDNFPDGEKLEMENLYVEKYGFTSLDAKAVVELTFKYKTFFLYHMAAEELGLHIPADYFADARIRGVTMFLSFVFIGAIPLLGYILWIYIIGGNNNPRISLLITAISAIIALFCLGYAKAKYIGHEHVKSALVMSFNGIMAGSLSFLVAYAFTVAGKDK